MPHGQCRLAELGLPPGTALHLAAAARVASGPSSAGEADGSESMEQALTVVWWSSALIGVVALVVAALSPRRRGTTLAVAAGGFLVAGVLGILSIGLVFVILASVCAFAATRSSPATE